MVVVIICLLILGIFLGLILHGFYRMFKEVFDFFFEDVINRNLIFTSLEPIYKEVLQKRFTYYKKLNDRNKKMFEKRVQKFINMKEFVGRGGLPLVTVEMEALIAASAVQLTFGLPSIYLSHFDTILIYPEAYYSNISQEYHRGEVNSKGFIVLSWNNFEQGYLDDTDGRNLGLHEMAHALKLSDAMSEDEQDFFDRDTFLEFIHYARHEMQLIADGHESFFRAYAATNDQEFFAVAVENFFERPEEFLESNRDIYSALSRLLNQNPLELHKTVA